MTMASLSASLISRNSTRQVERKAGELVLLPPKVKATPPAPPKPIQVSTVKAKARTSEQAAPKRSRTEGQKPARQRRTLRLMRETHRALRTLAEEKGVSQQSLMEEAVESLLQQENKDSARH